MNGEERRERCRPQKKKGEQTGFENRKEGRLGRQGLFKVPKSELKDPTRPGMVFERAKRKAYGRQPPGNA